MVARPLTLPQQGDSTQMSNTKALFRWDYERSQDFGVSLTIGRPLEMSPLDLVAGGRWCQPKTTDPILCG